MDPEHTDLFWTVGATNLHKQKKGRIGENREDVKGQPLKTS